MGIPSVTEGDLLEGNDALMRKIRAEERVRLIRRGESGKKIDPAKIAAAVRDAR